MLGLCERFGCLPSALYAEPSELLQLLAIEHAGTPRDDGGYADGFEYGD